MRTAGLFALLLLGACHDEPDFEERYDEASAEIQARADAIDAQLEQQGGEKDDAGSSRPAADSARSNRHGTSRNSSE